MFRIVIILFIVAFSAFATDFECSTADAMGTVPTSGGSATGFCEWICAPFYNYTGSVVFLTQLAFPCSGPPTGDYGWFVWINSGSSTPPAEPSTADYHGSFTPVDSNPGTYPPVTYTTVDIGSAGVMIPPNTYFTVGYDVTGMGGFTPFNGVISWYWDEYTNDWDLLAYYGVTGIIDIYGVYTSPMIRNTWASVKNSF